MTYSDTTAGIAPAQLIGFFEGWPDPPSLTTHLRMLEQSAHVALAFAGPGEPVAGYAAAISDGVLSAYISHLEVRPSHRHQGVGSELVRRLLAQLEHLYMIDLLCDPELEAFYAPLGFRAMHGMGIRSYANQSGASPRRERKA